MTQKAKLEEIIQINTNDNDNTTHDLNDLAGSHYIHKFRSMIGKLLFECRMTHPFMLRISSQMATKVDKLLKHHTKDLRALVKYYTQVASPIYKSNTPFSLDIYCDASTGNKGDNHGRDGFIFFCRSGDIVLPISWKYRKLRRVSRSTLTAEIL